MKIILPDSYEDITLSKYQKFMELDSEDENYESLVVSLFTGISLEEIKNVSKKDIDEIINHITRALQQEGKFKRTFIIDDVELGIIPNFDKITGGEFTDLTNYSKETNGYNPNLNRLIAVLYRPVIKRDKFNNYKIEDYKGTKGHIHLINKLPMSVVNGCLSFFLTLSNDLEKGIQAYTMEELAREQ